MVYFFINHFLSNIIILKLRANPLSEISNDFKDLTIQLDGSDKLNNSRIELIKNINLTLEKLNFDQLEISQSGGSIRVIDPLRVFSINNSVFKHRKVTGKGGSISFDVGTVDININDCVFEDHSASETGGTIHVVSQGKTNIKRIKSNLSVSNSEGGTLYSSSKNITIEEVEINNSKLLNKGGIASLYIPYTSIQNSWFETTYATQNGGGFYIYSAEINSHEVLNCFFWIL